MSDSLSSGTVTGDRIAYLGGRNVVYDLTGADPRFYRGVSAEKYSADEAVIFEAGQIYSFQIPVFLDSIVVERYDKDTNAWIRVDYDPDRKLGWAEVDKDTEAMSKAYLLDNPGKSEDAFNKTLVKQLQFLLIKTGAVDKINIRISYQRFYMDLYEYNAFDGEGPSYTPALGKFLLDKLDTLEHKMATNIANQFAVTDSANDMLEEDLTGTWPQNYKQDEEHKVDTTTGVDTLMPARGSFYAHDFRMWRYSPRTGTVQMANKEYNLKNQAIFIYKEASQIGSSSAKTTTTKRVYLTEENYDDYIGMAGTFIDRAKATLMRNGIDYELTNLNVAKTEKSESEYGVYDTIRMLTAFKGSIMITYHAFGGSVVFEDVQDMRQDILNTMRILYSKNLLTSDTLDKQPVIKDLINRIAIMEQYHSHFNQVEHAIYMGTKGFHWFNIAMLYDLAWGRELTAVDEIGTFRVESKVRRWCYEFVVSVDLKKKIANMLRCKTLATTDVAVSDLKDYVQYLSQHDDVAIRICWCGDGTKSGLMLQLGWNFDHYPSDVNGVDTDTVIVTNKSGMTSKWKLVYNPLDNSYTGDNSPRTFNHTKFKPTTDTEFVAGKDYYTFETLYTYFRTASEYVKSGVQYFSLIKDTLTDTMYYKDITADLATGNSIARYIAEKFRNGIYERVPYRKVPRVLEDWTAGQSITDPDNTFEVDGGSYSEDKVFQMPCMDLRWLEGAAHCYQLRRMLEPSDGLIAWVGNVNLQRYNATTFTIPCTLNKYTQPILDVLTIRGLSVRLFDRKLGKVISHRADLGICEAEFVKAMGTAIEGKTYYKRSGTGDVDRPYRYAKTIVQVGAEIPDNTYLMKSPDMVMGQIVFDLLDLCGSEFKIAKDETTGQLLFTFFNYMGTDSQLNNRFDLRQIELHF